MSALKDPALGEQVFPLSSIMLTLHSDNLKIKQTKHHGLETKQSMSETLSVTRQS